MKRYFPFSKEPKPKYTLHPLFYVLGLRDIITQSTVAEEAMLSRHAKHKKNLVELGVAEGGSARLLKSVADPSGTLHLVDPFLPGRAGINFSKVAAHKYVNGLRQGAKVNWIEAFSYDAAKKWAGEIDFLFIDANHSYEACLQDWQDWSPFVSENGIVAFHDARVFQGGWTSQETGPVRVVDENVRSPSSSGWNIIDEADSLVIVQRKKNV